MSQTISQTDELLLEDIAVDSGNDTISQIIVYNDDFNTFDWVIECFVDVLDHHVQQSEQLAILIHYKGKASVKQASFEKLRPLKDALVDRGLSAVIEHLVE
jgi:ATP-dependent Clp protease adaptor protein ClpS